VQDLTGRRHNVNIEFHNDHFLIYRGSLKSGIYFLELIDQSDRRFTQKIVVQ